MLDDYGSIAALGDRGGVKNWETFKAFVFGGHSGPTGRPLALLSFLIDANNWPADPWPFKRTNLGIHLVNGTLLGILTVRILRLLQFDKQDARWIALVCAAYWLLHPFLVSTTLYAVQRMAQLSTLFIFAGLLSYLYGRSSACHQCVESLPDHERIDRSIYAPRNDLEGERHSSAAADSCRRIDRAGQSAAPSRSASIVIGPARLLLCPLR